MVQRKLDPNQKGLKYFVIGDEYFRLLLLFDSLIYEVAGHL